MLKLYQYIHWYKFDNRKMKWYYAGNKYIKCFTKY